MVSNNSNRDFLVTAEIREAAFVAKTIAKELKDIEATLKSAFDRVKPTKVMHVGCGSSYYAASFGTYPLLSSKVAAHSLPASELIYMLLRPVSLTFRSQSSAAIFYSRSGETKEVILALQKARGAGFYTIGLTCSEGSTLQREAETSLVLDACAERSYYMTKSFIGLSLLGLISSLILLETSGDVHNADMEANLLKLSEGIERISGARESIRELAKNTLSKSGFVVLAPESIYPVAQEASLKLIEVSYTFAATLHALEFRHGPTALLERARDVQLVVLSASSSPSNSYLHSLVDELRHRGFDVLYISDEKEADLVLPLEMNSQFTYLLHAVAMYYFAVERALLLGYNPDAPRHIEKVVRAI